MILKEEPKDNIMHFFNKELFPLLNKYAIKGLEQDYYVFKTLIEETNIIKSRTYKQAWKNACQTFMNGISLCFDKLFLIEEGKDNNSLYNEYSLNKENFAKEVNILFRFEKVISEYYQNYKINEFRLYELEDMFNINENFDLDKENLDHFSLEGNFEENFDLVSSKTPLSINQSDLILENEKFTINSCFYNEKKNNNLKLDKKIQKKTKDKKNETNTTISNKIFKKKKNDEKIIDDKKLKSYKYDGRKKKIKEYKFDNNIVKRENVDKKILRKFKKFMKNKLREKTPNEVKNYINNDGFWPDYISMNLMPPFSYEKENVSFKSFNTEYICWVFEHKYSLELYNIFINLKYNDLLEEITTDRKLKENSKQYNLIKIYLSNMPMIYRKTESTRSTAFSINIPESDKEEKKIKKDNMSIEEENSIENNDDKNSNKEEKNMIIEGEINQGNNNYINSNIINYNYMNSDININNEIISSGNDFINNNDFNYINGNNNDINISNNINMNVNVENHTVNLDDSFEKNNQNRIQFDKNLFNIF